MTWNDTPRQDLHAAVTSFLDLVGQVPDQAWQHPGLGSWTVRDLVGHTGRALSTLHSYLDLPADEPVLADAVAYFRAAWALPGASADVAERGRQAGRALGPRPREALATLADQALAALDSAPDDRVIAVPLGAMRVRDYLPTRAFEVTVHSLDLAGALGLGPALPDGPLRAAAHLTTDLALARGMGPDLLMAVTGRRPLPTGASVV